jgi:AcrR family transcriptional regulator
MPKDRPAEEDARKDRHGVPRDSHEARLALELGALRAAGDNGYQRLNVQAVIDSAEVGRARFYREFADKTDCYVQAYSESIDCLVRTLLRTGADAPNWPTGFRQTLRTLERFITAESEVSKGMLAEVHVAGGDALRKRNEVFVRLAGAIDRARDTSPPLPQPAPAITAAFTLNAIEATAIRALTIGQVRDFGETIPDLTYLAVSFYFGTEAARKAKREAIV